MNVAKPLEIKTLTEFETMPKEEGWNYELKSFMPEIVIDLSDIF